MKVYKQIFPRNHNLLVINFKIKATIVCIAFLLLHFQSCKPKNRIIEYVGYVDNAKNGLIQEKAVGDIKLICSYKPSEYILINEKVKDIEHLDSIKISNDEIVNIENVVFFKLDLVSNSKKDFLKSGIKSESQYFSRLQYLISNVKDDLIVRVGKDTLSCLFSELERDYGLTKKVTLNLGFSNENIISKDEDLELIFYDRGFGLGNQIFKFNKTVLANVPKFNKI